MRTVINNKRGYRYEEQNVQYHVSVTTQMFTLPHKKFHKDNTIQSTPECKLMLRYDFIGSHGHSLKKQTLTEEKSIFGRLGRGAR